MAWVDGPSVTLDDLADKSLPLEMDAADWLTPAADELVTHSELQRAERLSFACLQVAPTSTEGDLRKLVSCRTVAMSTSHGLMDRLKLGQIVLDEQRQALRAKVALKSALGRPPPARTWTGGSGAAKARVKRNAFLRVLFLQPGSRKIFARFSPRDPLGKTSRRAPLRHDGLARKSSLPCGRFRPFERGWF